MYLAVTKRALDVFNCNASDPSDGYLYTTFTSLSCDGGGLCRCGEPGGVQERLVPLAAAFLIVYTAGFPLYVTYVIYRYRKHIALDQYLRANEVGDARETNPTAYDIRKRYKVLYYNFRPQMIGWMTVILMRKFFIAFSSLMFRSSPAFQLSMVLLVLFVSFCAQVLYLPYMGTQTACMEQADLLDERVKLGTATEQEVHVQKQVKFSQKMHMELMRKQNAKKYQLQTFWNKQKQMKMRKNGAIDRTRREESRLVVAARAVFNDYNTLETVLLGCAILVCLAGIMFESGKFTTSSEAAYQQDVVAIIAILVVVFSLVYYVLVCFAEVGVGMGVVGRIAEAYQATVVGTDKNRKSRKDIHDMMKNEERLAELDKQIEFTENRYAASAVRSADGHVAVAKKSDVDELRNQLLHGEQAMKKAERQQRALKKQLENVRVVPLAELDS